MSYNQLLNLSAEDVKALENLRSIIMPLTMSIEGLQANLAQTPDAPPNWDTIQQTSKLIGDYLRSTQAFLHDKQETSKPSGAEILKTLHPYPISPFPAATKSGLVDEILRKKPDARNEKWIDERLSTAATFCHVPSDWNIEPAREREEDALPSSETLEGDGVGGAKKEQRVKSVMDEDDIESLWAESGPLISVQNELFSRAMHTKEDDVELDEALMEYIDEIKATLSVKEDDTPESRAMEDVKEEGPGTEKQGIMPLSTMLKFISTGSA
ncbi:hypothetical protein K491DRAFT_693758 [Lophiostoma macrostomum CBS 122681]|uniref:Mediator of RNA polymerase II transcription subunit 8 n=1 Tax=Lophiostoma macrostomum CBS 122681 TaxID=1314788 RepID=A0A6A6T3J3_9PLEO|nr:hypothetical protein K491DRAFT_693758 [Lophiostoma macrostomum CBS 122681]